MSRLLFNIPSTTYAVVITEQDGTVSLGVLDTNQAYAVNYTKDLFSKNEPGGKSFCKFTPPPPTIGGITYAVLRERATYKYFIQLGDTKYHEVIECTNCKVIDADTIDEDNTQTMVIDQKKGGSIKKKTLSKKRGTSRRKK